MYQIEWKEHAIQNIEKLESSTAKRIIKKVEELSQNPCSKDIKRLKGIEGFRLRVGDYRVIFEIEGNTIYVLKVGHRKHIYDF